jgi:nucleoside recognition membrane protein YjiH
MELKIRDVVLPVWTFASVMFVFNWIDKLLTSELPEPVAAAIAIVGLLSFAALCIYVFGCAWFLVADGVKTISEKRGW